MNIEQLRRFVKDGNYYYSTHALIEAKKDGVEPKDILNVILNGAIIEEYPERKRILLYGTMDNDLPLHVICDYSISNLIVIPTVYIPDRRSWIKFRIRK